MLKKTIEVQEDKNLFVRITPAWSDYALFVVRENLLDLYDEILNIIERAKIFLEREFFFKHALTAIIYHRQNKPKEAIVEKSIAQESLLVENSGLKNRPKLGLVDKEELEDIIILLGDIQHELLTNFAEAMKFMLPDE